MYHSELDTETKESIQFYCPRKNLKHPPYPGITDIAMRYENGDYDDDWAKAYQKHLTEKYAEFFSEFTADEIRAIIKRDLLNFKKCYLNMDDECYSHKKQNQMYGHWYVLEWIYNHWAEEQIQPWHQKHLEIIASSRDQTCEEVVNKFLTELE